MRYILVMLILAGCAAETISSDEIAASSPARTQAMIACIELCVDDSLACYQNDPGDCNARCTADLRYEPDWCMPAARDWYQCVRGLYPFCVDGHTWRWGCYDEYTVYSDCLDGW